MKLKAAPHYVLVRCSIKEQKDKKEKVGNIHIPQTATYMKYNLEHGEIISIGEKAHKNFPEMKVGHQAIMHHFVEGENDSDSKIHHLIHIDKKYKYYAITTKVLTSDTFSRRNETYGVWDGTKIIPHPQFTFLKYEEEKITNDDRNLQRSSGGLLVFKKWSESREDLLDKLERMKQENLQLAKTQRNRPQVEAKIKQNEEEMERITLELNKNAPSLFPIAHMNDTLKKSINKSFGYVYAMKSACGTLVQFKGVTYRVVETQYLQAAKVS